MILYTPAGGIGYIPDDFDFYRDFIDNLIQRADHRGFLIIGEYPVFASEDFPTYLRSLSVARGLVAKTLSHSDGGDFIISKV